MKTIYSIEDDLEFIEKEITKARNDMRYKFQNSEPAHIMSKAYDKILFWSNEKTMVLDGN